MWPGVLEFCVIKTLDVTLLDVKFMLSSLKLSFGIGVASVLVLLQFRNLLKRCLPY